MQRYSLQTIGFTLLCAASIVAAELPLKSAVPAGAIYDVRNWGAVGDGMTLDSSAINATIAAAAEKGGGTVLFPPGRYLSASIRLRSNITLHLSAGAVIEAASEKIAQFDAPEVNDWGDKFHYQDFGHSHWQNSLIWGIGLENISIVGPGLIHGKGLDSGFDRFADESKGEKRYRTNPPGCGNKAIALRECRNVVLRDFSIRHGGWFGILATGVGNLTIDNLKIDTNRDGMDIDGCQNVRVTNCSVNSPWDDGICLKASYGLGRIAHCESVTISDCFLSGNFDEGTLLDGTFKRSGPEYKSYQTGRIKFGTESNGDFRNIAITNCVFDGSRGIAIESVDGAHIEDVSITNITMRHVPNSPLFIRLGARLRGPKGTEVGSIKRIAISNIIASDVQHALGNVISGLPGHPIEDISISNVRMQFAGGGTEEQADRVPPEHPAAYPEPSMFGDMPSYAFFFRHVTGLKISDAKLDPLQSERRPAVVLTDVHDAEFSDVNAARGVNNAPLFDLREASDLRFRAVRGLGDARYEERVAEKKL